MSDDGSDHHHHHHSSLLFKQKYIFQIGKRLNGNNILLIFEHFFDHFDLSFWSHSWEDRKVKNEIVVGWRGKKVFEWKIEIETKDLLLWCDGTFLTFCEKRMLKVKLVSSLLIFLKEGIFMSSQNWWTGMCVSRTKEEVRRKENEKEMEMRKGDGSNDQRDQQHRIYFSTQERMVWRRKRDLK